MNRLPNKIEDLLVGIDQKQTWGLAIYRTTYTPLSEAHFARIVDITTSHILAEIRDDLRSSGHLAVLDTIKTHYKPVVMNDRSQFNNMSLADVRTHYQSYLGSPDAVNDEIPQVHEHYCVVIDEEVVTALADAQPVMEPASGDVDNDARFELYKEYSEEWWAKVVEKDPPDEDDKGWMKCSVFAFWNLWADMDGTARRG